MCYLISALEYCDGHTELYVFFPYLWFLSSSLSCKQNYRLDHRHARPDWELGLHSKLQVSERKFTYTAKPDLFSRWALWHTIANFHLLHTSSKALKLGNICHYVYLTIRECSLWKFGRRESESQNGLDWKRP